MADLCPVGTHGTFSRPLDRRVRTYAADAGKDPLDAYVGQECVIIAHEVVWDYVVKFCIDGKETLALRTNFTAF
jgi:hypothetical protein